MYIIIKYDQTNKPIYSQNKYSKPMCLFIWRQGEVRRKGIAENWRQASIYESRINIKIDS